MDELIFFGLLALAAVVLGIVLPIVALTKNGTLAVGIEPSEERVGYNPTTLSSVVKSPKNRKRALFPNPLP